MSINIHEKNPCESEVWLNKFLRDPKYQKAVNDHQHVISTYKEMTMLKAAFHDSVYEIPRKFLQQYKILDVVPYYYIDYLLEKNPKTILDLGCGCNVFKPYIPGIIGMDASRDSSADEYDFFDEQYVAGHQQLYDSVISINCIHFSPIDTISQRLKWVASLIRPGYRGFVSFNIETWLMYTSKESVTKWFGRQPKFDDILNYVNDQILDTKLNLLVVDWPILHVTEHSTIRDDLNGNIRLVFDV